MRLLISHRAPDQRAYAPSQRSKTPPRRCVRSNNIPTASERASGPTPPAVRRLDPGQPLEVEPATASARTRHSISPRQTRVHYAPRNTGATLPVRRRHVPTYDSSPSRGRWCAASQRTHPAAPSAPRACGAGARRQLTASSPTPSASLQLRPLPALSRRRITPIRSPCPFAPVPFP